MIESSISIEKPKKEDERRFSAETCSGLLFVGFTICYAAYVAFGGLIFMLIEGGGDNHFFGMVQKAKDNVVKKFPNVSGEALDEYLSEIQSIGVTGLNLLNDTEAKWTYSQAVFFCVTLLTTIGYGHVAPISQLGKAICMIYTGVGIPLTLVLLACWVDRLMRLASVLQRILTTRFKGCLKAYTVRLLFLISTGVIICVLFFFIPALVFTYIESGWTYLDSLYFCFISLTTVGLGDFVPAKYTKIQHRDIYRVGVTVYLLTGIIAVMFLMSLWAEFRINKISRRNSAPIRTEAKYPSYGSMMQEKAVLLFEESQFELKYGHK